MAVRFKFGAGRTRGGGGRGRHKTKKECTLRFLGEPVTKAIKWGHHEVREEHFCLCSVDYFFYFKFYDMIP